MNFSKRLQDLRKSKNLSQPELASYINVSDRSISAWERGITLPNMETAIKLADFFNVATDYLMDRETHGEQTDPNIISLQRAYEKLTPINKAKMLEINKLMFKSAFDEEGEDDSEGTL